MGHSFEMIQSGTEKLLMLSEIIRKDRDDMRDLLRKDWMDTIMQTMKISGLKVMSKNQMHPILDNQQIFPKGMFYLSSSPYNYYGGFWAWNPAYSYWGGCNAGDTYCYSSSPVALRCVVELS